MATLTVRTLATMFTSRLVRSSGESRVHVSALVALNIALKMSQCSSRRRSYDAVEPILAHSSASRVT